MTGGGAVRGRGAWQPRRRAPSEAGARSPWAPCPAQLGAPPAPAQLPGGGAPLAGAASPSPRCRPPWSPPAPKLCKVWQLRCWGCGGYGSSGRGRGGGGGGGGGGVRAGGGGGGSIKELRFLEPWEPCAAVCNVSGTGEGPHRAEEISRYGGLSRAGGWPVLGPNPLGERWPCLGMRAPAGPDPLAAARRAPAGRPRSLPAAGGGAGRAGAALTLHGGARAGPAGSRSLRALKCKTRGSLCPRMCPARGGGPVGAWLCLLCFSGCAAH